MGQVYSGQDALGALARHSLSGEDPGQFRLPGVARLGCIGVGEAEDTAHRVRMELALVLPGIPDAADACVARLVAALTDRPGIDHVHVHMEHEGAAPLLCIHYDPERLPLARIRELADAAGAQIRGRYGHAGWSMQGVWHARRARTVAALLQRLPGMLEARVDAAGQVQVEFDRGHLDEVRILAALARVGVRTAQTSSPGADVHDHGHDHGHGHAHGHGHPLPGRELWFSLAAGALLTAGFVLGKWVPAAPRGLVLGCFLIAYGLGGFHTVREALDDLRLGRFQIDTLMLVAAGGAAALGLWAEGALLLFLFSLGHALEHYAMGRARHAIEALGELAPERARVRRAGEVVEIAAGQLVAGDVVLVRPHERLPADGFVVRGATSVDQSPLTGESIPVDKVAVADIAAARVQPDAVGAASRVFAGTLNGPGSIDVEVTHAAGQSTLSRVVQSISEAQTRRSPTQRFTDRIERVFVPAVLALAVLLLLAPLVMDEPWRDSFYRAMAVLVAASPCALAIATPSAVLAGIARAARGGVLIKGGAPLEALGAVDAVAFDKTGTVTQGRPRITDVVPAEGVTEQQLLAVAVAVESHSDHPLAAAIVADGPARLGSTVLPEVHDLQAVPGHGVRARAGGDEVWVGRDVASGMAVVIGQLRARGRTTVVVRLGGRELGVIGLMDAPRPQAREAVQRLHAVGIRRVMLLSGDHHAVAEAVAAEVGIDEALGDLLPQDKVEAVRDLGRQHVVAMVGDGVNDAPAMAHAAVGVAMGAAGSDVALETADIALMGDDLRRLAWAVTLGRRVRTVIRQNLFASLGVVAVLVPATILGLGIGPAVALHEGSTLLVVINALRLLRHGAPRD